MRKLLAVLALLLAGSGVAFADSILQTVGSTTSGAGRLTATVFNDSGSALTSGQVVVWDHDDTEYDGRGYPQVTTTATADDEHTAGVVLNGSCPDQALCEIVTRGWASARTAASTLTEDTVVSTSTTAGNIGDATAGNNKCYLGVLNSYTSTEDATASAVGATCVSSALCFVPVQVAITCVP